MKKNLAILIITLFLSVMVKGQNFFFIGENSYPCSETITLQPNSTDHRINVLNVLFAKDGKKTLIVVSAETNDLIINGKLIIYLDEGKVITLIDKGIYDYVDKIASTVYYLNYDELSLMKKHNINTVRYTLVGETDFATATFGGNFSASNKGTPTKTLVTNFFND